MEIKTSICAPNHRFRTNFSKKHSEEVLDKSYPGAQVSELQLAVKDLEEMRSRDQSMDGKHPFCSGATEDTVMTNSQIVLDYAEMFDERVNPPETLGDVAHLASKREEVWQHSVASSQERVDEAKALRSTVLIGGSLVSALAVGFGLAAQTSPLAGVLIGSGLVGMLATASLSGEDSMLSRNVKIREARLEKQQVVLEDTSMLMETAEAWNKHLAD